MEPSRSPLDAVAVIRVYRHGDDPSCLLIDVLAVGRAGAPDRVLGRVADPVEACLVLASWLQGMYGDGVPQR